MTPAKLLIGWFCAVILLGTLIYMVLPPLPALPPGPIVIFDSDTETCQLGGGSLVKCYTKEKD